MPYKLKKKRNEPLYWVITIETGKKHSKDPIPMDKAKAQLRILKSALKKGGADQDFDPEMAGLMGEPVQFAPAQANPFAGLFEPRPRRVRRPKPKRAISTVQGAIVTGDEKRKKTQGEYRGEGINGGKHKKFKNPPTKGILQFKQKPQENWNFLPTPAPIQYDLTNANIMPYAPPPPPPKPLGTKTSFFDWKAKQGEGKGRCKKCGLLR
jgi:hypothetical protein